MSYHDVNFNNLKIKFDKAISKTLGGGEDKRIHGYNWYDLTRVQNIFKSYSQKINLHEKFKPIIEYTNIASIHLEYNGYGDDGCLEGVEFLDKNGEHIYPSHMLRHFYMTIRHGDNVTPDNIFDYHLWDSDDYTEKLKSYLDDRKQYLKDMDPEEFATMDLEDWSNGIVQSVLEMGWSLHSIDNIAMNGQRGITLRRAQSYVHGIALQDTFTHFDTRILELMYPKVHKSIWEDIDEAFYGMLEPGWQNNHGSQNSFEVTIEDNTVNLKINQETNVMVTEREETTVVLNDTLQKRLKGFIKDMFPRRKSWETSVLDISLKKDQPRLKQLHDFITDMLNEKIERTRETE